MGLIVQKYGGTSVGSIERIKAVADRVSKRRDRGDGLAVVVSAMAGETNRLFKLATELAEAPNPRETDVLVATGEQVSAALLSIRLATLGYPSVSFLAHQLRLATDSNHGRARIKSVECERVENALKEGKNIEIRGFGSFKVKKRKGRVARNPRTGEQVMVPEHWVPLFKVSKEVKTLVNDTMQRAGL